MKLRALPLLLAVLILVSNVLVIAENKTTTKPLVFSEDWLKGVAIIVYGNQYGTCFWINPTHVATAAHVVNFNPNAQAIIIKGNIRATGRVVALDRQTDIAVLYVENSDQFDKHIFPIARSIPRLTSTIYVIGYPSELLQITGSLEELSEHPRVLECRLSWIGNGLFEVGGITDAGNSGGPVVDYSGNVLGIVSFALRGPAGFLYFASSAGNLKELCRQHNIAYIEGTSGILPENFVQNPALQGAIAGATASIVVDLVMLALGIGIGVAIFAKRRRH